ncbi:hypothetical protein ACLETV_16265 [Citrobacter braakii]|uniref:hypothetical protein n=1 Tax=Enterobacteriaceae TaxID=543 RepID=UPI001866948B|nr:hypothetical protein [Enterobacter hormaechei]
MKLTIRRKGVKSIIQDAETITIELDDGRTLEIEKEHTPKTGISGITIWGGAIQEANCRTLGSSPRAQCLGIYPLGANVIHVWPYPTKFNKDK